MSLIIVTMLMALPQTDLMATAASKLSVRDERPAVRRSPFRIDRDLGSSSSAKDRAIAEDGQRCQVVGARMCTKRPRTLLSAPIGD